MKLWIFGLAAALVLAPAAGALPLKFLYHTGDQYRYYGSSTQTVTVDGRFLQQSLLSYRIAFSVAEATPDGGGRLTGHITYLTQRDGDKAAAVDQEYDTNYQVDALGVYSVPPDQVMPVVRNVPTLPGTEVNPGDTWSAPGEEVHDLRDDFGVDQLLRVPIQVAYTDLGPVVRGGTTLEAIRSDYRIDKRTGFRYPKLRMYPLRMAGYSHQTHYFNAEKGREEGYEEEYRLELTMNTGQVVVYAGTGESHLVDAVTMDKPALVEAVKKGLEDRGFPNVEVKAAPQGVTINLDNILFPGDSALLVASEKEKLRLIGEVLRQYPDRDILVEGHTADVVGGLDPQTLSENRAAAVGNELVASGVRKSDQIVYKGWGASRPVASNDTEAGRAKNRRVEITLLEN